MFLRDDDRALHVGMIGADVGIGPRRIEHDARAGTRVDIAGIPGAIRRRGGVCGTVIVRPRHRRASGDLQRRPSA